MTTLFGLCFQTSVINDDNDVPLTLRIPKSFKGWMLTVYGYSNLFYTLKKNPWDLHNLLLPLIKKTCSLSPSAMHPWPPRKLHACQLHKNIRAELWLIEKYWRRGSCFPARDRRRSFLSWWDKSRKSSGGAGNFSLGAVGSSIGNGYPGALFELPELHFWDK